MTVMKLMVMVNGRYKYEHGGDEAKSATSGAETRREKEGAVYCRRDKIGTASEWFSHEHANSDAQQHGKGRSTGSANAARMRNESDCWYNYDKAAAEETTGKKRAAGVKPGGNEMHGIFHHATANN